MNDIQKMMGEDVEVPQVRLVDVRHLVAYDKNARTHSPDQLEQLGRSMLEFGWTNPVLADEMSIVAGHGRVMAAQELYRQGKQITFPGGEAIPIGYVPVIDCSGWPDAKRRAYILADNKLAMNAGWDEEMLAGELRELSDTGYDLDLIGFDEDELAALIPPEVPPGDGDPDEVPDLPDEPHSVDGDIWQCGPHRVMCGSSLDIACWEKLMAGEVADAAWTDPPYNVDYESKLAGKIKNDKMSDEDFQAFLADAFVGIFSVMKAGASIYVTHSDTEGLNFRNAFLRAGFKLSGCLIWRKNSLVLGRSDYQFMHEPCLYGWKPGAAHRWYGGRKQTTIIEHGEGGPIRQLDDGRWAIQVGDNLLVVDGEAKLEEHPGSVFFHDKPKRSELHPTTKPIGLIEKMLTNSSRAGDVVVDGFGGSGSTMIAADRLGMKARLLELDPKYVDVIVRRMWHYSGVRPVHAVTGEPFPEEGADRQPPPLLDEDGLPGDMF